MTFIDTNDRSFNPGHENFTAEYEPQDEQSVEGDLPPRQLRLYFPTTPNRAACNLRVATVPFTLVRYDSTQASAHSAISVLCGEFQRQHEKQWAMDFLAGSEIPFDKEVSNNAFFLIRLHYDASSLRIIKLKNHRLSDHFNGTYTLRRVHKPFIQMIDEAAARARADWERLQYRRLSPG